MAAREAARQRRRALVAARGPREEPPDNGDAVGGDDPEDEKAWRLLLNLPDDGPLPWDLADDRALDGFPTPARAEADRERDPLDDPEEEAWRAGRWGQRVSLDQRFCLG